MITAFDEIGVESFRVAVCEVIQHLHAEYTPVESRAQEMDKLAIRIRSYMEPDAPKTLGNLKDILNMHCQALPLQKQKEFYNRCVDAFSLQIGVVCNRCRMASKQEIEEFFEMKGGV